MQLRSWLIVSAGVFFFLLQLEVHRHTGREEITMSRLGPLKHKLDHIDTLKAMPVNRGLVETELGVKPSLFSDPDNPGLVSPSACVQLQSTPGEQNPECAFLPDSQAGISRAHNTLL